MYWKVSVGSTVQHFQASCLVVAHQGFLVAVAETEWELSVVVVRCQEGEGQCLLHPPLHLAHELWRVELLEGVTLWQVGQTRGCIHLEYW